LGAEAEERSLEAIERVERYFQRQNVCGAGEYKKL
jgi:hypothetical protein